MRRKENNRQGQVSGAYRVVFGCLIVGVFAAAAGSGAVSFGVLKDLAETVGFQPPVSYVFMPLIEVFLVLGAAEVALRTWDHQRAGGTGLPPAEELKEPQGLVTGALWITVVLNMIGHLPAEVLAHDWLKLPLGAAMSALIPWTTKRAIHLLLGRVQSMERVTRTRVTVGAATASPLPDAGAPPPPEVEVRHPDAAEIAPPAPPLAQGDAPAPDAPNDAPDAPPLTHPAPSMATAELERRPEPMAHPEQQAASSGDAPQVTQPAPPTAPPPHAPVAEGDAPEGDAPVTHPDTDAPDAPQTAPPAAPAEEGDAPRSTPSPASRAAQLDAIWNDDTNPETGQPWTGRPLAAAATSVGPEEVAEITARRYIKRMRRAAA